MSERQRTTLIEVRVFWFTLGEGLSLAPLGLDFGGVGLGILWLQDGFISLQWRLHGGLLKKAGLAGDGDGESA